jgi:hypothetical protein
MKRRLGIVGLALAVGMVGFVGAIPAYAAGTPHVTKVSPSSGPESGGTTVTVTGAAFSRVRAVYFGSLKVTTGIHVYSTTKLTVRSPRHAKAGYVDVRVLTGSESPIVTADRFTYVAPPKAVTGLKATAVSTSQINLSWTKPTGGTAISGVEVCRTTSSSTMTAACSGGTKTTLSASTKSYKATGLTPNRSYYFTVFDLSSHGGPSAGVRASAKTRALPTPNPVTGLTATAVSTSEIDLAWALPTSGTTPTSIEICRASSSTTQTSACAGGTKLSAAATATSFHDTGLPSSATNYYTVFTLASGSASASAGATASATTQSSPNPNPVTGLSATDANATEIDLAWTRPTTGVAVASVEICRAATSAAQTSACSGGTKLTATGSASSFNDVGLAPSTSYYYTVFNVDSTGTHVSTGATANATTRAIVLPAIHGTVTAAGTGTPLAGVIVTTGSNPQRSTVTAADGTYVFDHLTPGFYQLCFDPHNVQGAPAGGYAGSCQVYGGQDVTSTSNLTVNQTLAQGGTVTGTVTSATGGSPLGGVKVWVYDTNTGQIATPFGSATSAANGTYTLSGVGPGTTYDVCFDASGANGGPSTSGYGSQCYNNVAWDPAQAAPASATLVPVTAGATRTGVDASLPESSGISGTVTAASNGAPVAGVRVWFYDTSTGMLATGYGNATTSASGTYSVIGLAPGKAYDVCFDANPATGGPSTTGYQSQCYVNQTWSVGSPAPAGSTTVSTTAGTIHSGINGSLAAAGAIGGTVRSSSSTALSGVDVWVYQSSSGVLGTAYGHATTSSTGTYTISGLAPSTTGYTVCFNGSQGAPPTAAGAYQSQCYNGRAWDGSGTSPSGVTLVPVAAGGTAAGVNATLPSLSAISGTVTAATGGAGLGNVTVDVIDPSTGNEKSAVTGSSGTYSVTGLLPSSTGYDVCFDAQSATGGSSLGGYGDQCYNNVAWDGTTTVGLTGVTAVTTTAGATHSGVNASLPSMSGISGTVTAATGGAGVGQVNVQILDPSSGTIVGSAVTASGGAYSVKSLPPSSTGYDVCFDASSATGGSSTTGYLSQCYQNQAWGGGYAPVPSGALPVTTTAGGNHTGVNAALQTAGAISGTVTAATGGGALSGANVYAFDPSTQMVVGSVSTDSSGAYTISGLPASTSGYDVCFDVSQASGGSSALGYASQCYANTPWNGGQSQLPSGATLVAVTAGSTHSGINAAVADAAGISGTTTAATGGAALSQVNVDVYDPSTGYLLATGTTDTAGAYSLSGIPASATGYDVCFDASVATGGTSTTGYVDQCYLNQSWTGNSLQLPAGATLVTTTAGATHAGVNASIVTASAITGTVTAATGGAPLTSVVVYAVDPATGNSVGTGYTDASGVYTITGIAALASGYDVCFDPSSATGGSSTTGYAYQCYNAQTWDGVNADIPATATKVPTTSGATAPGINAALPNN